MLACLEGEWQCLSVLFCGIIIIIIIIIIVVVIIIIIIIIIHLRSIRNIGLSLLSSIDLKAICFASSQDMRMVLRSASRVMLAEFHAVQ